MSTTKIALLRSEKTGLPENTVIIDIPHGYRRVYTGAIKPSDRYLDCLHLHRIFKARARGQSVVLLASADLSWISIDQVYLEGVESQYARAELYACLIRPERVPHSFIVKICERCDCDAATPHHRYCETCLYYVKHENKNFPAENF